jgi:hypothetical protein
MFEVTVTAWRKTELRGGIGLGVGISGVIKSWEDREDTKSFRFLIDCCCDMKTGKPADRIYREEWFEREGKWVQDWQDITAAATRRE